MNHLLPFFVNMDLVGGVEHLFLTDPKSTLKFFSSKDEKGIPQWVNLFKSKSGINEYLSEKALQLLELLAQNGIDLGEKVRDDLAWSFLLKEESGSIFVQRKRLAADLAEITFKYLNPDVLAPSDVSQTYISLFQNNSKNIIKKLIDKRVAFDEGDAEKIVEVVIKSNDHQKLWMVPYLNQALSQMENKDLASGLIVKNLAKDLKNKVISDEGVMKNIFSSLPYLKEEHKIKLLQETLNEDYLEDAIRLNQKLGNPSIATIEGFKTILPILDDPKNDRFFNGILENGFHNEVIESKYGSIHGMVALSLAARAFFEKDFSNLNVSSDFIESFTTSQQGHEAIHKMSHVFGSDFFDYLLQKYEGVPVLEIEKSLPPAQEGYTKNFLMTFARCILPGKAFVQGYENIDERRENLDQCCREHPEKMREMTRLCLLDEGEPATDFVQTFWGSDPKSLNWTIHLDILLDHGFISGEEAKALLKEIVQSPQEIEPDDWRRDGCGPQILEPLRQKLFEDESLGFSDWKDVDFQEIYSRLSWIPERLEFVDKLKYRVEHDMILGVKDGENKPAPPKSKGVRI